MKLSVKQIALIKITAVVILIVVEVWFITMPNIGKIKKIQREIARQLYYADQLLAQGQTMNKLREDLERIQPFLDQLNKLFITNDEQLTFIVSLEELAKKQAVTASLSIGNIPQTEEKNIVSVPITLQLQGSFQQTMQYLIALQRLNFYVNIKSITMDNASNGTPIINSTLKGLTYWKLQ